MRRSFKNTVFLTTAGSSVPAPVAGFTADQVTVAPGQSVTFDYSSSTGTITGYSLTANGTVISTAANPVVAYEVFAAVGSGPYTMVLIVSGPGGTSAPFTRTNYILPVPIVNNVDVNLESLDEGESVYFFYDVDNQPTAWTLEASDGGEWITIGTTAEPVVTWSTFFNIDGAKTYNTRLTASNAAGPSDAFDGPQITINSAPTSPLTFSGGTFWTGGKENFDLRAYGSGGDGGPTEGGGSGQIRKLEGGGVPADTLLTFYMDGVSAVIDNNGSVLVTATGAIDNIGAVDGSGGTLIGIGRDGGTLVGGGAGCGGSNPGGDGVDGVSPGSGSAGANGGGNGGDADFTGPGSAGGRGAGGGASLSDTPGPGGSGGFVLTWTIIV